MPLYSGKIGQQTDFKGGKNILASEQLQFIEVGGTLDATKFETGYNATGLIVAKNTTSGLFEDVQGVELLDEYTDFGILNVDFTNDGETNVIAGEIIIRGSVYEQKLVGDVTDEFKAKAPMIRFRN